MLNLLITIPMVAFAGWFWWKAALWARQNWRMALDKGRHVKTRIDKARNAFLGE